MTENKTQRFKDSQVGASHDQSSRGRGSGNLPESVPRVAGILPVETITHISKNLKEPGSLVVGWWLPGQGIPYTSCGEFKTYEGCLNIEKHPDGKPLIKKIHNCCFRLSCPVCMEKAISRAADRIVHRLTSYEESYPDCGDPIHVTISLPQARALNFSTMRRKAARLAQKAGITAAVMIYHPWRLNKRTGKWRFGPHFHLIGFGWVENTVKIYRKHGWVIKNIGVRKDPFKVVRYQLSHCGVHPVRHSTTYIGGLSGRKFKAPPMPRKTSTCPTCGGFMLPVKYTGDVNPFDSLPEGYYSGSMEWVYDTHGSGSDEGCGSDRSELNDIYEALRNE